MINTDSTERTSMHGMWSSRLAFILAATGSAVGLGNIWKFPYMTGENGGGAFVIIYIICIFLIGIPVMMCEVLLGRRGRQNPFNTLKTLAVEEKLSPNWRFVGGMAILAAFLILSFYSVIAGWTLAYVFRVADGMFIGSSPEEVKNIFSVFTGDAERLIMWHTLIMVITVGVVAKGVEAGLERAVKYLIPGLFLILIMLVGYSATTDSFADGLRFMFIPDFSKLTGSSILAAMGMAFFSLSLGMAAIMMYGAYLPKDTPIAQTVVSVALADLTVALLAGIAIFPIVLANGLEPAAGPGLIFNTLPLAFGSMPSGTFVGSLFFILLVFAALTSAISLLEPALTWLMENRKMSRINAAIACGSVVWLLGLGTVFSFNLWSEYKWSFSLDLGKVQYLLWEDKSFFEVLDFLTSNIMLPLGGLLVALFTAYLVKRESCEDELAMGEMHFNVWYFVLRYITPVAVLVVLLNAIGVI